MASEFLGTALGTKSRKRLMAQDQFKLRPGMNPLFFAVIDGFNPEHGEERKGHTFRNSVCRVTQEIVEIDREFRRIKVDHTICNKDFFSPDVHVFEYYGSALKNHTVSSNWNDPSSNEISASGTQRGAVDLHVAGKMRGDDASPTTTWTKECVDRDGALWVDDLEFQLHDLDKAFLRDPIGENHALTDLEKLPGQGAVYGSLKIDNTGGIPNLIDTSVFNFQSAMEADDKLDSLAEPFAHHNSGTTGSTQLPLGAARPAVVSQVACANKTGSSNQSSRSIVGSQDESSLHEKNQNVLRESLEHLKVKRDLRRDVHARLNTRIGVFSFLKIEVLNKQNIHQCFETCISLKSVLDDPGPWIRGLWLDLFPSSSGMDLLTLHNLSLRAGHYKGANPKIKVVCGPAISDGHIECLLHPALGPSPQEMLRETLQHQAHKLARVELKELLRKPEVPATEMAKVFKEKSEWMKQCKELADYIKDLTRVRDQAEQAIRDHEPITSEMQKDVSKIDRHIPHLVETLEECHSPKNFYARQKMRRRLAGTA